MGYRSEVKIVAGKKAAAEIRDIIKKFDGSPLTEVGTNKRGDTLFVADWVKWYEDEPNDFPDVAAVMEVVEKYEGIYGDDTGKDTAIEYCRVGESDNDTDYRANGDSYGYLSVGVRCDQEDGFKPKPKGKKAK